MKGQLLGCLFFFMIITYKADSYSVRESTFTAEARGCGLQMDAKQLKNVNGMVVESGREGNEEVFNKEVLQETIHKGKGAYGGADLLRQHHTRSAATYPFLVRPLLSTIGHIMIGYVLLVGFF
ncbi:uncharacterized protein LOC100255413 [Vitis vinifera]|uniref:Uncharacterized protein n=1 Tax=Vitis vinifera TaxID=29760 RepID=D7U1D0_VITVI|eukprot:XP_002277450.1 PREDICTED: uncharacterized protein LOC100255413 [Vitis vinifera]